MLYLLENVVEEGSYQRGKYLKWWK